MVNVEKHPLLRGKVASFMVAGGGLRRVEEEVEIICGTINVHFYFVKLKICVNNVHFYKVKLEVHLDFVHFYLLKLKVGADKVHFYEVKFAV